MVGCCTQEDWPKYSSLPPRQTICRRQTAGTAPSPRNALTRRPPPPKVHHETVQGVKEMLEGPGAFDRVIVEANDQVGLYAVWAYRVEP